MSKADKREHTLARPAEQLVLVLACATALASCKSEGHALLLTVQATSFVESFDLRVKAVASGAIVLDRAGEPVDPAAPNRDISVPGNELKLAIEFGGPGEYLLHFVGRASQGIAGRQFALRRFAVAGIQEHRLLLVPMARDSDLDDLPACAAAADLDCGTIACADLDCDDDDERVHPFAPERCGNGLDDDCSAGCAGGAAGDVPCEDADGDGVAADRDCDDEDPCRSPEIRELESLCGLSPAQHPTLPQACLDQLARTGTRREPPFCDNGVDEDCSGQDLPCRVDEDCDGFSPPGDCDDRDPEISPEAEEACDGEDNNCSGVADEGCTPCDVDGDGHAAPSTSDANCTDAAGQPLPRDDDDDYDAGVNPSTTASSSGAEGGTVLGALRGYCATAPDHNGRRPRDVDHDGDGATAASDGCPAEICDVDGDGFANTGCSPPKSQEDCDDSDPQVFPGAPDRCGDGIKQNCVADTACDQITDADGDGYAREVDCADGDAKVHPWAVELCNGADDDCDELTDEGNPGADGQPIPTGPDDKRCNAADEGRCGGGGAATTRACTPGTPNCSATGRKLSGTCVCSRVEPTGIGSGVQRQACTAEASAPGPGVRCFGALLPDRERCDAEDWDCNGRPDDPTGARPLAGLGGKCGTNVGSCTQGSVAGCDLSAVNPEAALIEAVLAAQGEAYNRFWVCTGAVLPTAERCNGKDDDCDGTLPQDELDGDGDKYLPCTGCTTGSGRLDLLAALDGCRDCDDSLGVVHPGAIEACNDRDDDCDGATADGSDECGGSTTCCSTFGRCLSLQTDASNCGQCGRRCASGESCSGGKCVCGATGSSCSSGQSCVSGSCTCVAGGACSGCCDGDSCQPASPTTCGANGSACTVCSAGECQEPVCSGGSCDTRTAADGTACDNNKGQCRAGSCCTGGNCWNAATRQCVSGKSTDTACGRDGSTCTDCTASSEQCKNYVCQ